MTATVEGATHGRPHELSGLAARPMGSPTGDGVTERPLGSRDRAILAAREQGDTLQEIGARFGMSREWVRQILVRHGAIDSQRAKHARARRELALAHARSEEVLAAFREGGEARVIARGLGLSPACVRAVIATRATARDRAARRLFHSATRRTSTPKGYPDEKLVRAVQQVASATGRVPSAAEYGRLARSAGLPSISTVENRLGGWNGALRAAGIVPARPDRRVSYQRWTEASCLDALRGLVAETGAFPSRGTYDQLSRGRADLPCVATLVQRLGRWSQIGRRLEREPVA